MKRRQPKKARPSQVTGNAGQPLPDPDRGSRWRGPPRGRVVADRLKGLNKHHYRISEAQAEATEARLRSLWYGTKLEDDSDRPVEEVTAEIAEPVAEEAIEVQNEEPQLDESPDTSGDPPLTVYPRKQLGTRVVDVRDYFSEPDPEPELEL